MLKRKLLYALLALFLYWTGVQKKKIILYCFWGKKLMGYFFSRTPSNRGIEPTKHIVIFFSALYQDIIFSSLHITHSKFPFG